MSDHSINDIVNIFEKNYNYFISHADKITNNIDDSHDIVHDVFIKIWINPPNIKPESIKSYFISAIRNTCLKFIRQNKKMVFKEHDVNTITDDYYSNQLVNLENDQKLKQLTKKIPKRRKQVFECFLDGMKNNEIAENLNISINTVKTHKRLVLKMISDNL